MSQTPSKPEIQNLVNRLQGQLPDLRTIEILQCKASFKHFVISAWPTLLPGKPFVDSWSIDLICDHLQAAAEGKIRRLIMNVPPRFTKSTLTSVLFPIWVWLKNPDKQFLLISHSLALGIRDNVAARDLIRSAWFQGMFPEVQLKQDVDTKESYYTTAGGSRSVAPVRGTGVTGQNADVIILDDPNYADQVEDQRQLDLQWFDNTVPSRFNDFTNGVMILIQQRLAVSDFTGHLVAQGGWDHVCLPMEYEVTDRVTSIGGQDKRTVEGELLNPQRFPLEAVERIKVSQAASWAGQYQQRPVMAGGELIQTGRFKTWYKSTLPEHFDEIVLSADLSFAGAKTSDYCVIQAWGRKDLDCYLLDQTRGKFDFTQQLSQFEAMCNKWPTSTRLVEKAANGFALIATLTNKISRLIPIIPKGSKINRVQSITPMIDSGHIFIPSKADAPWIESFILECSQFPRDKHDDMVDAMSQALQRFDKSHKVSNIYVQHGLWT